MVRGVGRGGGGTFGARDRILPEGCWFVFICTSISFEVQSVLCGQGPVPRCSCTSTFIHADREGTRTARGVLLGYRHGGAHEQ